VDQICEDGKRGSGLRTLFTLECSLGGQEEGAWNKLAATYYRLLVYLLTLIYQNHLSFKEYQ
jgi:hypothetical protein